MVTRGRRGQGRPLAEKDRPGLLLHCCIGVMGRVGRRDLESGDKVSIEEGEGGMAFKEGKDTVGDLVDGEVLADSTSGSFPHEGSLRGVELGKEGAVASGMIYLAFSSTTLVLVIIYLPKR